MFFGFFLRYVRGREQPGVGSLLKAVLNAVKPAFKSFEGIFNSHAKSDGNTDSPNPVSCGSSVVPTSPDSRSAIVVPSDDFSSVCSGTFNTNAVSTCFFNYSVFVFCDFLRMISIKPQEPFDSNPTTCQVLRLAS